MLPHHVKCNKPRCENRFVPPRNFIQTPFCRLLCPQHRREKETPKTIDEDLEFHGTTRRDFQNRISVMAMNVMKETRSTHQMVEFNPDCIELCPKCDSMETFANACERCGHCLDCSNFVVCVPTNRLTLTKKEKKVLTWAQVAVAKK